MNMRSKEGNGNKCVNKKRKMTSNGPNLRKKRKKKNNVYLISYWNFCN